MSEWVSEASIHSCEVNQSELCFREEQGQDTKHQFDLVCLQGDTLMCRTLNDCRRASGVGYFWITLCVRESGDEEEVFWFVHLRDFLKPKLTLFAVLIHVPGLILNDSSHHSKENVCLHNFSSYCSKS